MFKGYIFQTNTTCDNIDLLHDYSNLESAKDSCSAHPRCSMVVAEDCNNKKLKYHLCEDGSENYSPVACSWIKNKIKGLLI